MSKLSVTDKKIDQLLEHNSLFSIHVCIDPRLVLAPLLKIPTLNICLYVFKI